MQNHESRHSPCSSSAARKNSCPLLLLGGELFINGTMDEWELLQRFAQQGSQEAFAELVCRHLNLVYSSARRQVRSPELAQEVAQTVFLELAREAARLKPGPPLAAWLYLVTRRTALNALRSERRRQAREHAAYELSAMNPVPSVWEKLEPLLDEALETLNPRDRSALLLRYFENKPLREVGAALGASEEAAQKRVARAIEHLRGFFAQQGVAISAVGLATHLSSHAVEAAPATLGSLIATATSSLAATTTAPAIGATHAALMTTLQKTVAVGALVVMGVSVYEVRALAGERQRLVALEHEVAALAPRELAARRERDAAQGRAAAFKAEALQIAATAAAPATGDPTIAALVSRAHRLKQRFDSDPALKIPELALLTDADWLDMARERSIDSDADLRASLARSRSLAKSKLTRPLLQAFTAYVSANEGRLPASTRDLRPHLISPVEPAIVDAALARYEIKVQGSITQVPDQAVLILEREQTLIDRDYDAQVRVLRSRMEREADPFKISTIMSSVPGRLAPMPPRYLR